MNCFIVYSKFIISQSIKAISLETFDKKKEYLLLRKIDLPYNTQQ